MGRLEPAPHQGAEARARCGRGRPVISVAAVVLAKDEADVIGFTVAHLLRQVDQVLVQDNGSRDGTFELLRALHAEHGDSLVVLSDPVVGYYQAAKTTALAAEALVRGHQWVIPCDSDEYWYATDGRTITEFLGGMAPDVAQVEAFMYHHLPSALDPTPALVPNPFRRIAWRQRNHGSMGKVACRLRVGLEIHQGNHTAYAPGGGLKVQAGVVIRHFSWRSEAQYLRKILNGAAAYAATDLPANVGEHWRQFGNPPNLEAARDWYQTWAFQENPEADDSLIYDPAPGA